MNDETADASQTQDPTSGGIDAMLAIAEARQRDNQNARHLVETSSFDEDITKDGMPLDDVLSLSSITSRFEF